MTHLAFLKCIPVLSPEPGLANPDEARRPEH